MRKWAKGTAGATLLTASFVAFGAGPALADVTNGNGSVLGGNQVNAPISVPVDISGNSVAVVGRSLAGSTGGATVHDNSGGAGGNSRTSGRNSIVGGNQVHAPISAPINACGDSVAVIGHALSDCEGGAKVRTGGYDGVGHRTSGTHSIGGGNQVNAPISAPVNICGNSAAVIGAALAGCRGGATVKGAGYAGGDSRTSGRNSIVGGNQIHAPVNAPINVCGNSFAVIGDALSGCEGGAKVRTSGYSGGGRTDGRHSILGGNQVHAPVNAPTDVCGNAAAVIGHAVAACQGSVGGPGTAGSYYEDGGHHTSGAHSIGGGNQVHAPVNAPVDVCGNAVAVVGRALGSCGADQGGYNGGGDDCAPPSSYRMSGNGLPQLPIDPASLGSGAMPVAMGATPALPKLTGGEPAPQSALNTNPLNTNPLNTNPLNTNPLNTNPLNTNPLNTNPLNTNPLNTNPLDGGLRVPPAGVPPKNLPPVDLAAADSSAGTPSGALLALALGGMFAASAGTVSVARRLGRRSSR
jgi:hypothetical protein